MFLCTIFRFLAIFLFSCLEAAGDLLGLSFNELKDMKVIVPTKWPQRRPTQVVLRLLDTQSHIAQPAP